jgi:L-fuculose-phosphate aldolase
MSIQTIREEVVIFARRMQDDGLVVGTAGNVSARVPGEDGIAITPSGFPYEKMETHDIPILDLSGAVVVAGRAPSVERELHLAIYQARPDVGAIFHTHSTYSSVLAVLHLPLPPIVEELVHYVGGQVEVATYAPSQTPELSCYAIKALGEKQAAFLANHGNVCCGKNLASAYQICQLIERVAKVYLLSRTLGMPIPVPEKVLEKEQLAFKQNR